MNEEFYRKQIIGLKMILNDTNKEKDPFITRKYVLEKLNMILNGGIGFHSIIKRLLDETNYEDYNK